MNRYSKQIQECKMLTLTDSVISKKTEEAEAVVNGDDDHIPLQSERSSDVERSHSLYVSSSVYPHHHRLTRSGVNSAGYVYIQVQTVLISQVLIYI